MGSLWKGYNAEICRHWCRLRTYLTGAGPYPFSVPADEEEPPLRAELFSSDQLAQHGVRLATSHRVAAGRVPDQLLARLTANEGVLIGTCNQLTAAVSAKHRITPAAEWLLDNFYLAEDHIRIARRHLPKGYSR